jgi:DNA-binding CsgD family transcriptional regulator
VSVSVLATGPIGRLARFKARSPWRHAAALVAVASAVAVLEWPVADFDHGTHLLLVLTLVIGIALLLGPGPATTGFATGGSLAGAASVITVQGAFASPHAYVQLLAYVVAGSAVIVLVLVAARSRQHLARPAAPASAPVSVAVAGHGLVEPLTAREAEILRLLATGITVDEIAGQLFLSPNTVKTHLTHVYAKLGVRGRAEAVRAAIHCGCLTPGDICPHLLDTGAGESPVPVMPDHRNR